MGPIQREKGTQSDFVNGKNALQLEKRNLIQGEC